MGTLSNDPLVLSMYGAFYKVFGAAGSAIVASLDYRRTSYVAMFGSYWGLTAGSLIVLLPLVVKRVTNTSMAVEAVEAVKVVENRDEDVEMRKIRPILNSSYIPGYSIMFLSKGSIDLVLSG